jgi:hypothetical protein
VTRVTTGRTRQRVHPLAFLDVFLLFPAVVSLGGTCRHGRHGLTPPTSPLLADRTQRRIASLCIAANLKPYNQSIEQDHRFVKRRVNPGLAFGLFHTAQRTLRGYEAMYMVEGSAQGHRERGCPRAEPYDRLDVWISGIGCLSQELSRAQIVFATKPLIDPRQGQGWLSCPGAM